MALKFNQIEEIEDVELSSSGKVIREPKEITKRRTISSSRKPSLKSASQRLSLEKITTDDANISIIGKNEELIFADGKIAIDTETTGLLYRHGDMPWMVSMADSFRHSWCTAWAVDPYTRKVLFTETEEYHYLKKICEDPYIAKTYFNRKFDIRHLKTVGIETRGEVFTLDDVSLQARVYNTDEFSYKLKPLAKKFCNLPSDDEELLKKGVAKLRRRAKSAGIKIFDPESTTNSHSKDDKSAPDYWLVMYAHLLYPEDPAFVNEIRELAEEYCRKDTLRTILLDQFYLKKFEKDPAFKQAYALEMMLSPLVEEMEDAGIKTFREVAIHEREVCNTEAAKVLQEIREETKDKEFNPEAPEQYSNFLFKKPPFGLGLPPTERTAGGQCKTGYKEIAHLAWHPFIQKVTKYKALSKAVSLFFDKYIDVMIYDPNKKVWIVNAEINQNNTKTFRFSMSNPNLQQAANPETSARGASVVQVRSAFGPMPGYDWWMYDYSGQELRVLGGLMHIPAIINAVKEGRDIPTELGNKTWGGKNNPAALAQMIDDLELNQHEPTTKEVAEFWSKIGWYAGKTSKLSDKQLIADQVLAEYDYKIISVEKVLGKTVVRTRTKMCLYGKAYGAGPKGVVGLLLCKLEEAKVWLRQLDEAFPEMKNRANEWASFARANGFITNAYGRKLTVDPDFAYRATNYRIQGSAAEMMKISMLRCKEYIDKVKLDARIVLTVHDELIFEVNHKHSYPWFLRELQRLMEDHERFVNIPMSVGISRVRERWDKEEKDWEKKLAVL